MWGDLVNRPNDLPNRSTLLPDYFLKLQKDWTNL